MASKLKQLSAAMRSGRLMRFDRRFEKEFTEGYVLAVGEKWFLLACLSMDVWLNGFECHRISDVRNIRPDPYAKFDEAVLRKRGDRLGKKPQVNLDSIEEILLSANRAFPMVTIHTEKADPEVCWIGRVLKIERGIVSLLEISPGGVWDKKCHFHFLKDITRVDFGGDYEDALHLVGGDPSASQIARAIKLLEISEKLS